MAMEPKTLSTYSNQVLAGSFRTHLKGLETASVIVIGGGISGVSAACALKNAHFKVTLLESQNRLGGRIHTDYSFGCPVDMGASWLHGVCNENALTPLIRTLSLKLYRTSGENSVIYDHDLESCAIFDKEGNQIPQKIVTDVGEVFKKILSETEKVRDEHKDDMSILQAIEIVLERSPHLRQQGVAFEVLQWYICRMEAWFATDVNNISLKIWDQEHVLSGGHGLMVQGYDNVIKTLASGIDIRLNHRVKHIVQSHNKVIISTEGGKTFMADAAIITVPLGVLKAKLISFDPQLPEWKLSAISDIGFGNENKIALLFDSVFWPNVEFLGVVAETSYSCGYFLNLHKATGNPVLVFMASGSFAWDLEKLSNVEAVKFVMLHLKKMLPNVTDPIQYLVSRWGSDLDFLGCYTCDLVGKPTDVYERYRAPLGNLFFGGEAASVDHSGSVHGAYSSGLLAAEECRRYMCMDQEILKFSPADDVYREKVPCKTEAILPLQISRL